MKTPANQFEKRAHELFVQSCDQLDAGTRMRLREARGNALTGKPPRRKLPMLLPAGAMAASVLALAVTWHGSGAPPTTHQPAAQATTTSTQAVPDNADVDMYSDLDFYRWLAQQPAVAQRSRN